MQHIITSSIFKCKWKRSQTPPMLSAVAQHRDALIIEECVNKIRNLAQLFDANFQLILFTCKEKETISFSHSACQSNKQCGWYCGILKSEFLQVTLSKWELNPESETLLNWEECFNILTLTLIKRDNCLASSGETITQYVMWCFNDSRWERLLFLPSPPPLPLCSEVRGRLWTWQRFSVLI